MGYYDHEPKENKGIYLRLKSKGDEITVRLVGPPYREPVIWKEGVDRPLSEDEAGKLTPAQWAAIMRSPDYEIREAYHWAVIDRQDGHARIYTGTPMVYKAIKNYAQNPAWGDPTTYDFQITRTQEPGRYYEVTPLPDKRPLSTREQQLVDELNIRQKKPNAAPTDEPQIDDIDDWLDQQASGSAPAPAAPAVGESGSSTPGYDRAKATADRLKKTPEQAEEERAEQAAAAHPDPVIEDIGDEPINLDDIPF